MIQFLSENMAPIMFAALVIFLLLGYPVAFSLAFVGLGFGVVGISLGLLDTVGQLFGPVRGGLAYAVVFVGALLAATTGVVAASVIAMGLISLPIMLRYGYDRRLASGVIAASGTLAQIIPPSLVLTALYAIYVLIMTVIRPKSAPALPVESRTLGSGIVSLLVITVICGAIG